MGPVRRVLDGVEKDAIQRGGVKEGKPVEERVVEGVALAMRDIFERYDGSKWWTVEGQKR